MRYLSVLAIISVILISGCVDGETDITSLTKTLPQVQSFLDEHPNADIKVTLWSEEAISNNIESIRTECEAPIEIMSYYRVMYSEEDVDLTIWMDKETNEAICVIKTGGTVESSSTEETETKKEIIEEETDESQGDSEINIETPDKSDFWGPSARDPRDIYDLYEGKSVKVDGTTFNLIGINDNENIDDITFNIKINGVRELVYQNFHISSSYKEGNTVYIFFVATPGSNNVQIQTFYDSPYNIEIVPITSVTEPKITKVELISTNYADGVLALYFSNTGDVEVPMDDISWLLTDNDQSIVCANDWGAMCTEGCDESLGAKATRRTKLALEGTECDISSYPSNTVMTVRIDFSGITAIGSNFIRD